MEIICDTHIWYNLGRGMIDNSKIKENDILVATHLSIYELCFTENYLGNFEDTQNAVRAMFKYSAKNAIFEPPFAYLKVVSDRNYVYDIHQHSNIFKFSEKIAQGYSIEKTEEFASEVKARKHELEEMTNFCNECVQNQIKPNIKNKENHRKENSILLNRQLINQLVAMQTKSDGLSVDFDWKRIELFEQVLKLYFNELETGAKMAKPNDWFDLFLLLYVNPNRKIWTREGYWKQLIKQAGFEEYLYEK